MGAKGTLAHTVFLGKVERKRSRGKPAKRWLDDVKELVGLSLNEMWREPDDCVVWRMRLCRVASNGLNGEWHSRRTMYIQLNGY